uniref:Uncharacterized protein n=1 Tax=Anopheles funestus TaxID=62324 RepID=A0A182S3B9_ANOFN
MEFNPHANLLDTCKKHELYVA